MRKTAWLFIGFLLLMTMVVLGITQWGSEAEEQKQTNEEEKQGNVASVSTDDSNGLVPIEDQDHLNEILQQIDKRYEKHFGSADETARGVMESQSLDQETSSGSSTNSETNVQVDGVDEGDKVKVHGDFMYYVRAQQVLVLQGAPIEEAKHIATIQEEDFYPTQIYTSGDKLVVLGSKSTGTSDLQSGNMDMIAPSQFSSAAAHVYDLSNKENPTLLRTVSIDGSMLTSRLVDDTLYLLSMKYPAYYKEEPIDERPKIFDSAKSMEEPKPIEYDQLSYFPDSMNKSFLTVAAFNIKENERPASIDAYLGSGQTVYMNESTLLVGQSIGNPQAEQQENKDEESFLVEPTMDTLLYRFDVNDTDVDFKAKGKVPGTVINQFALEERDGYTRIATTIRGGEGGSSNALYVLNESMDETGSVTGLAQGEQIYSVRYMEDRAYVVTFERTDPLFVIDLKEPTSPNVLGELKIPGFSTYLHPLDEDHLIGFGKETEIKQSDDREIVEEIGYKVSLFNIEDVTNPIEKDVMVFGSDSAYSELEHDHKAFYTHPSKPYYGFPITWYNFDDSSSDSFQGAYVLNITKDGIQEHLTVEHPESEESKYESHIERLVSMDDNLYTFSFKSIVVTDLETKEKVKEIQLPKAE
ncbi:hypothetical protein N781_15200 [Pontibacillus halophilus JSM 076056 = DSM 19796]|uniref:Beta propeller domain-containing protein n=1 Tax=Pontibacillus halophilus JSM 076056 = DSM 19796 TaxID=1385510 RepID=A0A0A5GHP6_9BACI|nr:beta-propeller domain-containing protein [Pontibacillus halophilus]KGX92791.1 hypothetical protein N781_15200 [Pontibacillus halophilus JSM 076056 = DSM 19796]